MKIANYIGGFRPFHNGHISMISQALNDFDKVRIIVGSYQNAISILDNLTVSIYDLWETKRLDEIPGVGEGLGTHLNELFLLIQKS